MPAMMDNPMNTQVRMTQDVKAIRPYTIGTLLDCLHSGQTAGEKDTENSFWKLEILIC